MDELNGRSEKAILNDALVGVTRLPGVMAWRNNTGQGWQGRRLKRAPGTVVKVTPGMVILEDARPIAFGLPGSGDVLGVAKGRGFSLEGKTLTGALEQTQRLFRISWERAGGAYGVFRSPDQAVSLVQGLLRGE